jgi:hypothetical protein
MVMDNEEGEKQCSGKMCVESTKYTLLSDGSEM